MANVLYNILAPIFGFVCVFMILLILIQKGRGGGLSSAFGGAGGNTAFGSKTGDVLTWVTAVVFVIFLVLSMLLIRTGDAVAADNSLVLDEGETQVDDAESGEGASTTPDDDDTLILDPPVAPAAD
ncbi:MAG: preprotein translocase subunit SecG [Planctomycetota bacterium]